MARRTVEQIRADTIVHERTAMLNHRRQHSRAIDEQLRLRRITEAEAAFCKRVLGQFADDLAIGLHVDDDPEDVSAAMRAVVKAQAQERVL